MEITLGIFAFFMIFWFLGIGAAGFHVFKYASPGDKLLLSFFVFLGVATISFLTVISFVMGGL